MCAERDQELLGAIAAKSHERVTEALRAGASPHCVDDEGVPAILLATDTEQVHLIAALLDTGADINATDDVRHTPLTTAVLMGSLDLVNWLIPRGADIHHGPFGSNHDTTLTLACWNEGTASHRPDIAAVLIAGGVDVNRARADGWTPLLLAAQKGSAELVRLLLESGADPSLSRITPTGTVSPIDVATHHGRSEIVDLLKTHLGDPSTRGSPSA